MLCEGRDEGAARRRDAPKARDLSRPTLPTYDAISDERVVVGESRSQKAPSGAVELRSEAVALADRLGVLVQSEPRDRSVQRLDAREAVEIAHHRHVIEHETVASVETADRAELLRIEKDAGLMIIRVDSEPVMAKEKSAAQVTVSVERLCGRGELNHPAGDNIYVRKRLSDLAEAVDTEHVVGIDELEDCACRSGQSVVDRCSLPAIGFGAPVREPGLVFFDSRNCAVGGAAVHHDIFEVRITLQQHRTDGFFDELALVEARGDDRDPRPGAAIGARRGRGALASVQGQPVRPGGGGGRL